MPSRGCPTADTFWQLMYFHFVLQMRAEKIKEGRATSFTYMINDKKRLIGKIAASLPPQLREPAFIVSRAARYNSGTESLRKLTRSSSLTNIQGGQAIYTFVTLLIPVFVLYDSKFWCSAYLIALFAISAWNGASFYSESWPRADGNRSRAIGTDRLVRATRSRLPPSSTVEVFARRFQKVRKTNTTARDSRRDELMETLFMMM